LQKIAKHSTKQIKKIKKIELSPNEDRGISTEELKTKNIYL